MKSITVFTPTFNRAHTLQRAFNSLLQQTSKDFEWLIIDDGSTDGTKELVESFSENADFNIRYFWKENGGRHTAVNYSYQYLRTPYVVTLDSDDELLPDAIELMLQAWKSIPDSEYDRFWCVSGRDVDAESRKLVGKPYPKNINSLSGKAQRKVILKCSGEKHCCRKVNIHTQYKFPEYSDTKFVQEDTVWEKINRKYDQYCVNDVYGLYHTESEDSLANGKVHSSSHYKTFYYFALFYINELFDEFFINKRVRIYTINVSRCAILTKTPYNEVMHSINKWYKRAIVTCGYGISWIWILIKHEKEKQ